MSDEFVAITTNLLRVNTRPHVYGIEQPSFILLLAFQFKAARRSKFYIETFSYKMCYYNNDIHFCISISSTSLFFGSKSSSLICTSCGDSVFAFPIRSKYEYTPSSCLRSMFY